jgi:hypothetical protein
MPGNLKHRAGHRVTAAEGHWSPAGSSPPRTTRSWAEPGVLPPQSVAGEDAVRRVGYRLVHQALMITSWAMPVLMV